jgi:uncharacterized protein
LNIAETYNNIRRKIRRQYFQLLMEKTSAGNIALSFALGTFIAILPTPGFGIFIALLVAYFVKRLNNLSILASFAFWNPLLLAPVYLLSYKIGDWMFHPAMTMVSDIEWVNTVIYFLKSYMIGNAILAVLFSVGAYIGVYRIIEIYKRRQAKKKQNRRIRVIVPPSQIEAA